MRAVAARITLRIPWAQSLKEKRSAVSRFIRQLDELGSMSIAEVDDHDRWQTATIGLAIVAPDGPGLGLVLDRVRGFLGKPGDIEVVSFETEDIGESVDFR